MTPITYSKVQLTDEQKRILSLLGTEGKTHDQAALELNTSTETIKRRIKTLREMLGVDSVYQLIAIAVSKGWIPAPRAGKK